MESQGVWLELRGVLAKSSGELMGGPSSHLQESGGCGDSHSARDGGLPYSWLRVLEEAASHSAVQEPAQAYPLSSWPAGVSGQCRVVMFRCVVYLGGLDWRGDHRVWDWGYRQYWHRAELPGGRQEGATAAVLGTTHYTQLGDTILKLYYFLWQANDRMEG